MAKLPAKPNCYLLSALRCALKIKENLSDEMSEHRKGGVKETISRYFMVFIVFTDRTIK